MVNNNAVMCTKGETVTNRAHSLVGQLLPEMRVLGTVKEYLPLLQQANCFVGEWAKNLFPLIAAGDQVRVVQPVMVSGRQLGLEDGACYLDVRQAAVKVGLGTAPPLLGLALGVTGWAVMPEQIVVIGATAMVCEGDESLLLLARSHNGQLLLDAHFADKRCAWPPDTKFVFVLP